MRSSLFKTLAGVLFVSAIMIFGNLSQLFLWWFFIVPCFFLGVFFSVARFNVPSFLIGLCGGILGWGVAAFYYGGQGGNALVRVAMVANVSTGMLILLSALPGGLLAGLAVYSGNRMFKNFN